MSQLISFWLPCILMGVGIAIDVAVATLAKFKDRNLSWKNWTFPIATTHIIFPAFGYYFFWGIAQSFPTAEPFLGFVGFTLVALFIYEVICNSVGTEPLFGISDWIGSRFSVKRSDARRLMAVLAVSWDALWSGPAKAAQAVTGEWSSTEVFWSFFVAGATVATIAQTALIAALLLRKVHFKNARKMATFNYISKYVELSVIGGFGVLSLRQGLRAEADLYSSIGISAIMLMVVFLGLRTPLFKNELKESIAAMRK